MSEGRRLPVGVQSFEKIRTGNYLYVDKTAYLWKLLQQGSVYFLSRPRRFGKSLLVSTMEAYFSGRRELFDGLAIEKLEDAKGSDAWKAYPVIKFSLSGGNYHAPDGLEKTLERSLENCEKRYDIEKPDFDLPNRFGYLIEQLFEKTGLPAVVLVDEYDKPLLETMFTDEKQEERNRNLYKGFFSILKDEDQYLKFVFFTDVTKFSKVSIFSDLNQLTDISLSDDVSAICGITERELLNTFQPEIMSMSEKMRISEEECVGKLAQMYDGYCFSPAGIGVYNPYSLLRAFLDRRLRSYWFETGTPEILVKKLSMSSITAEQLTDGVRAPEMSLTDYRVENPDPLPLFYQTGYLTIKNYDEEFQLYTLAFPNNEVKYGFLYSLVQPVLGRIEANSGYSYLEMIQDLRAGEVDSFLNRLKSLFAAIPYPEGTAPKYEHEWRNQIFIILAILGQNVNCEVHSAKGRADCIIKTDRYIYIFEFKLDKSAEEALRQIEDKGYAVPYQAGSRKICKVGVNFSSGRRNIEDWKIAS